MTNPDDGDGTERTPEPSTAARSRTTTSARKDRTPTPPGGSETPPARTPARRARRGAPPTRSSAAGDNGGSRSAPGSSTIFDWDDEAAASPAPGTAGVGAPAAIEVASEPQGDEPAPTAVLDAPAADRGPTTNEVPKARQTKAVKRPERRFRQTIVKVDLWSVTKMALCFYVSAMGVVLVSLVALWTVADSAGIIDNVENFIGDLFSSEDFQFVSGEVLRGAALVSVVLVALLVAFTIIAASFYNIFSELFGGVEVVIREEEQPAKR